MPVAVRTSKTTTTTASPWSAPSIDVLSRPEDPSSPLCLASPTCPSIRPIRQRPESTGTTSSGILSHLSNVIGVKTAGAEVMESRDEIRRLGDRPSSPDPQGCRRLKKIYVSKNYLTWIWNYNILNLGWDSLSFFTKVAKMLRYL